MLLRSLILSLIAVLIITAGLASANPTVSLVAGTVRQTPEKEIEGIMLQDAGVELAFLVAVESGTVLGLDETSATLTTLKDDAGTDLSKTRGFGDTPWLGSFPQVSEDGKHVMFQIVSRVAPKRGSKTLTVDAQVAFRVGLEATKSKLEDVRLEKGQTLKLGSLEATIKEIGEGWGDGAELNLESKQDFDAIKSITFLGADGKPLESRRTGTGRFGWGNDYTYNASYSIPKDAKVSAIEVEWWTRVETIKVSIQRDVTLGL
jgi:hypothetical protein